MLVAYLPAERLLIEADLLDTHEGVPTVVTDNHRALYNQVKRLGLDVRTIVPIHGRPIAWTEFAALIE
jgi:hypothetical protein